MTMLRRREEHDPWWPEPFGRRFFERFWPWPAEEDQIRVDEFVDNGELVVRADLPGVDPDRDIEISLRGGALHIRAQRRQETETKEKDFLRSEVRYGSFTRTLPLPVGADEDDVKASYRDGILEVRLPVDKGKAAARRIPISKN